MSQNIALTRVSFSSLQTCLTRVHSKVSRKIVPVANNGQECQTRVPKSVLTRGSNNVLQLSYNTVACSERWENDPPTMPNEKQQLLTLHKRHSGFKTQKSEGKKSSLPKLVCSQPKLAISWNFRHESENLEIVAQHKEPYPCLVEHQFLGRDYMVSQPRSQKQRKLERRDGGWLRQHSE